MKISPKRTAKILLFALPFLLLAAILRVKYIKEERYTAKETERIREIVQKGTTTFGYSQKLKNLTPTGRYPHGFAPTYLTISITFPTDRIGFTTQPNSRDKMQPDIKILLLPVKITNFSNKKCVLGSGKKDYQLSGFYNELYTGIWTGTPFCAVSSPRPTNIFNDTYHVFALEGSDNSDMILLPHQTLSYKLFLNSESHGSYYQSAFVKTPGKYRIRLAFVFKVDGVGQYAISEPFQFTVTP